MNNSTLIEKLADQYISGKIKAAQDGDTEAAKELLEHIKESIVKVALKTPKDIIDSGLCFIDFEIISYLFDAITRFEDGESVEDAFLLKKRRGAPSQENENLYRDIWFAKEMAEHISQGKAKTVASLEIEIEIREKIKELYPDKANELISIIKVSQSTIERAYDLYKQDINTE